MILFTYASRDGSDESVQRYSLVGVGMWPKYRLLPSLDSWAYISEELLNAYGIRTKIWVDVNDDQRENKSGYLDKLSQHMRQDKQQMFIQAYASEQSSQSLHCWHTKSMDADGLRPKSWPQALPNMSAWAFKGGFCTYVIHTKISWTGPVNYSPWSRRYQTPCPCQHCHRQWRWTLVFSLSYTVGQWQSAGQPQTTQATQYGWTHQSIPRIQTEPNLKTISASWYAPRHEYLSCCECQTVWIKIRPDIMSGLIWVQTFCKGYQQYGWTHQSIPMIQTEPNLKTIPASWYAPCHECQIVWIQIRPDVMSCLIWVQTVCKNYQQHRQLNTVELIKASPWSRLSQTWKQYWHHDMHLVMSVK